MKSRTTLRVFALAAASLAATAVRAAEPAATDPTVEGLRNLSLEDLTNLTVTSVAKRPEPLSEAPAAIYVITADDIRRSGAASLPEALRLAPNLQVARINAYSYAITARGMNSAESANKLLVLVNGRSVYEPIASGVLWQQVDVVLSNVERIEVISGPGGTLWGANAVNGVINVITKRADATQGLIADASGGNLDRHVALTYGGGLGSGTYRFSVQGFQSDGLDKAPGDPTHDGFSGVQTSLRLGRGTPEAADTLVFNTYSNQIVHGGGAFWGGDVMGRIRRSGPEGRSFDLQAYVARDDRSGPDTHERRDTYSVQAQQALSWGRNQLVWGGEARAWREYFLSTNAFHFAQPKATIGLGAVFVQDDVALRPDVKLTVGLKLEDNSYSGFDWLPNVRLAWTPADDTLLWAAVSRAARTPNRIERELEAANFLAAAPGFHSESLWAYEVGARAQPTSNASFSISAFYDHYEDLRTDEFTNGGFPIVLRNGARGDAWGMEAWGTLDVASWWRLKGGVSTLQKNFEVKPTHSDLSVLQIAGEDPKHQAQLRSQMRLSPDVDLDMAVREVGRMTRYGVGVVVPAYTEADARLAWRVRGGLELSLAGFNLLHRDHLEIDDRSTAPLRRIPRSVVAGLRWGF